MISLSFDLEFNYRPLNVTEGATNLPAIPITLVGLDDAQIDTIALVDTGARGCLFKGELARIIGITDILAGREETVRGLGGGSIKGYFHQIAIRINNSKFSLDAGFTMSDIAYNILGGTFLAHVQLGVREHHEKLYISPIP